MYGNLRAELARKEMGVSDIAAVLGTTERTAKNKLSGKSEFSFFETIKIRDALFPSWNVEKLFSDEADREAG